MATLRTGSRETKSSMMGILAVTPVVSLYTLDIRRFYPGYLIWGRSVLRLALAALFFCLRPRGIARAGSAEPVS